MQWTSSEVSFRHCLYLVLKPRRGIKSSSSCPKGPEYPNWMKLMIFDLLGNRPFASSGSWHPWYSTPACLLRHFSICFNYLSLLAHLVSLLGLPALSWLLEPTTKITQVCQADSLCPFECPIMWKRDTSSLIQSLSHKSIGPLEDTLDWSSCHDGT